MADEKQFPPTEAKIAKLRRSGVYPMSSDVVTLAALSGLILGVAFALRATGSEYLGYLNYAITSSTLGLGAVNTDVIVARWMSFFFKAATGILLAVTTGIFLSVVLQNRFLVRYRRAKVSGRELMRGEMLLRAWTGAGKALLMSVLGAFILAWVAREIELGMLVSSWDVQRRKLGEAAPAIGNLDLPFLAFVDALKRLMLILLTVAAVVGVISRVTAVVRFRRRFGMTREELIAEYSEGEVRPEVRAAQRELLRDENP